MFLHGEFGIIWTKYYLTSVFIMAQSLTNWLHAVEAAFKKYEDEKKRVYNQRIIDVEKATFTPLVL